MFLVVSETCLPRHQSPPAIVAKGSESRQRAADQRFFEASRRLGSVDKLAMLGEQDSLRLVDR
ncbi:hypothetical protein, partial [Sphingobium xenophagum]|uniref:hypothetical protein n=1 Tax=Sphingobium xenophagum TaxID=121428 RepID=UPI001CB6B71C